MARLSGSLYELALLRPTIQSMKIRSAALSDAGCPNGGTSLELLNERLG
jgi:hypothetical protein